MASRIVLCLLVCTGMSSAAGCGGDGGGVVDAGRTDAGGEAGVHDDVGPIDGGARVPMYHRADDSACGGVAPAGNCSFGGGGGGPTCAMDSDCTTGANGRCIQSHGGAAFCSCSYDTCVHDTDCPTSQTCACHGAALHPESNECVPGNCRVDADCGAGGFCSPAIGGCGALAGYYCHTAADTCVDDADCTTGVQGCQYVQERTRWECTDLMLCP